MEPVQGTYEEVLVGLFNRILHICLRHHSPTVSFAIEDYSVYTNCFLSFYVGVPNFANDYINKYDYDYDGLEITNPRPTAFHIKQKKSLKIKGAFSGSGHITPFNATCRLKDTNEAFAVLPVPRIAFGNGAVLEIDQDLDLSCVDCLSQLASAVASNKSSSFLIEGSPDLKYGALPTAHLNIHKTIKVDSEWALFPTYP